MINHADITVVKVENCFFVFLTRNQTENMNATVDALSFDIKKYAKTT